MATRKPAVERDVGDTRRVGIESPVEGFTDRAHRLLGDTHLHDALALAMRRFVSGRNAALRELPEAPELRRQAYAIKAETIAHLDRYLEMAARAVEDRGGKVFFAATGAEVVRYVAELVQRRGARLIVKSKSMVTEEIELNRRLEETCGEGLEIVETDLGEWIAQLAGEQPSHIVGPILHMNRFQIAGTLSRVAGETLPPNAADLMQFARRRLRQKFLAADIGISGANFIVAETGTIVLVTNEGNEGLATGLPPVHMVVAGMERLLPRFQDLSVFLNILARAATGQRLTVYTNLITGPRREGELDGPEELHVIFLDNGRSNLLGSDFEEALYCIRCGSCLNVCPVYRQVGGHAYGSTYSGPIGAVITPLLKGLDEASDLPHASSLCGACWEACPVGIPLHDMLLKLRNREVEEGLAGKAQELMADGFRRSTRSPRLYGLGMKAGRLAQAPLIRHGRIRAAPPPLSAWTDFRDLAPLAGKSFRELWKEGI